MKIYPKDTKFNAWSLHYEKQRGINRPVIKRWVIYPDGCSKQERLPTRHYAHFRDNPSELESLLLRLNAEHKAEQDAKTGVAIKHAYIDEKLLERYERQRKRDVPSQGRVKTEIYHLRKHFLNFFIGRMNLVHPKDWYRCHKEEWADYLLSNDVPKAPATKRDIIQTANRFIAWLHEERPTEVPLVRFNPISTERFKDMRARREIDPKIKHRTFIPDEHWKIIKKSLPPEIKPFVMLAYNYGCRRGETLGFLNGDVGTKLLTITRQLEYLTPEASYKPLKGKEARTVPHWFSTNVEAYDWVESAQKYRIDPDHLTELWKDLMKACGYSYDFHDLRHTWVTKSARIQNIRDVQLAAGHKHLKTTMGYMHDDRQSDNVPMTKKAS